ncbi:unnamed protein product [Peronospora effusa]|nr:unnamed protein product [Peronospora effusa]
MSTVVKSVTFNQEDVPAHGLGVKTTNEERTLGSPVVEKAAEEITSNVPESLEGVLNLQNEMEKLRLGEDKSIMDNPHFNNWVRDLAKTIDTSSAAKEVITKVSELYGDEGLLKMLNILIKDEVGEVEGVLQGELKSALMASWEKQEMSARGVFEQLKLDQETDHTLYIQLLTMWVRYTKENNLETKTVITSYDGNISLMLFEGLSEIEGTEEIVKSLQDSLMTFWAGRELSAEDLFSTLKLDNGGSKSNYDMWVKYVAQEFDTLQPTKEVILKSSEVFGEEGLLKMLNALDLKEVGQDIQSELTSALMASWKEKEKKPVEVLMLLESELMPEFNHKVNIGRIKMWNQYVNENFEYPGLVELLAMGQIKNIAHKTIILEDLKQINLAAKDARKNTENAE